jgi:hypothetical protein
LLTLATLELAPSALRRQATEAVAKGSADAFRYVARFVDYGEDIDFVRDLSDLDAEHLRYARQLETKRLISVR